jgi:osmotically-inducible protein OsmY
MKIMKRTLLMNILATGALLATGVSANAADYTVAPGDTPATQSDLLITANVKGKLEADVPDVAPAIVVTTQDGVVTLKGVALTQDYLVRAVFDARSVDGVVRVKNELSLQ